MGLKKDTQEVDLLAVRVGNSRVSIVKEGGKHCLEVMDSNGNSVEFAFDPGSTTDEASKVVDAIKSMRHQWEKAKAMLDIA
jgi:hypothetical protein